MKRIIILISISILVFFSTSFLSVLFQIPPINTDPTSRLDIGFPFKFYNQFTLSDGIRHGWTFKHLVLDIIIALASTLICGYIFTYIKKQHTTQG